MKQYDKVWVPARKEDPASDCWQIGTPMPQHGPVIVLTIEEAKEMWNRAVELFYGQDVPSIDTETNEDFKTYLQSKGITI